MRRVFNYEFEDESKQSTIYFEYDEEIEEKLVVKFEGGIPVLYGNKQAFLLLAKTFSKLSSCDYRNGFHLHINTDFDADEAEAIRVVLNNS
ncbi:MAG TPA: hypothetical protein EYP59_06600 [Thiotrichaceae bacterium]|nr:hypothetical protein [Thiotrichaceae bacterium]